MRPARACKRLLVQEDGQALIYGAGLMVLLVAIFYGAVDIGQLVLGQIEAQNAADAAALSSAALKVGVHNTRSLAYRATTGQIRYTRAYMLEAMGEAFKELGSPQTGKSSAFNLAIKRATTHQKAVERLRDGLIKYNEWAAGMSGHGGGPLLARQAAGVGYFGNLGTLANADRFNLTALDEPGAFAENSNGFSPFIGGVPYRGEALRQGGHAGKSLVRIEPRVFAFGSNFLHYNAKAPLYARAAAGPLPADTQFGQDLAAVKQYGITWYTVRLLPVGGDTEPEASE